ncbi:MAG: hypothetical protein V1755_05560 [Chloroflexota bacterium]
MSEGTDIKTVAEYVALAKRKAKLDAEVESVDAQMKKLHDSLVTYYIENGVQRLNVDGRTVYLHKQTWASLKDTVAGVAAFKSAGLGDMCKESINGQTLSAWVREQLDGKDIPADSAVNLADLLDQPQEVKDQLKISEVVSLRVVK